MAFDIFADTPKPTEATPSSSGGYDIFAGQGQSSQPAASKDFDVFANTGIKPEVQNTGHGLTDFIGKKLSIPENDFNKTPQGLKSTEDWLTNLGSGISKESDALKLLSTKLDKTNQKQIDAYNAKVDQLNSRVDTFKNGYSKYKDDATPSVGFAKDSAEFIPSLKATVKDIFTPTKETSDFSSLGVKSPNLIDMLSNTMSAPNQTAATDQFGLPQSSIGMPTKGGVPYNTEDGPFQKFLFEKTGNPTIASNSIVASADKAFVGAKSLFENGVNKLSEATSVQDGLSGFLDVIGGLVAFTGVPISPLFSIMDSTPGLSIASKTFEHVVGAAGSVASDTIEATLNTIPGISDETKKSAGDFASLLAQLWTGGKVIEGVEKTPELAKQVAFKMTKDVVDKGILPKTIVYGSDAVQKFINDPSSPEGAKKFFQKAMDVSGNRAQIEIDTEHLVTISDKPWFKAVKEFLGMTPEEKNIYVPKDGKARITLGKNLEEGKGVPTPEEMKGTINDIVARVKETVPAETPKSSTSEKPNTSIDALTTEAPKYKSAEEFVKAQPIFYHGAKEDFNKFDASKTQRGIFITPEKSYAQDYATSIDKKGGMRKGFIKEAYLSPDAKVGTMDEFRSMSEEDFKKKFDALKQNDNITVVFNSDKLKTKDELTDIYNKAVGGNKNISEMFQDHRLSSEEQNALQAVYEGSTNRKILDIVKNIDPKIRQEIFNKNSEVSTKETALTTPAKLQAEALSHADPSSNEYSVSLDNKDTEGKNVINDKKVLVHNPNTKVGNAEKSEEGLGQGRPGRENEYTQNQQYIDIRGKEANDFAGVAALLKDYRNPIRELFHIIYTDDAGKVLAHSALTSNEPDLVNIEKSEIFYKMQQRADRLGATNVYVAHNHPSGNAKPSTADRDFTQSLSKTVENLRGHIVTDHDHFYAISPEGATVMETLDLGKSYKATADSVENAIDAINVYKSHYAFEEGKVGIVIVNKQLNPVALENIVFNPKTIVQTTNQLLREHGGTGLFIGGERSIVQDLIESKLDLSYVLDIITKEGDTYRVLSPAERKSLSEESGSSQESKKRMRLFEEGKEYTPKEIMANAEAKAEEPKAQDYINGLKELIKNSRSHDAFMEKLTSDPAYDEILPKLDRLIRDAGYQNFSDLFIKEKNLQTKEVATVPKNTMKPIAKIVPTVVPKPQVKKITVPNSKITIPADSQERKDQFQFLVDNLKERLDEHPGKILQRFISEGVFHDFKNPDLAKTPSGRARIEKQNARIMEASKNALQNTALSDQYDNPDVIRDQIAEYKGLQQNLIDIKGAKIAFEKILKGQILEEKDEVALDNMSKNSAIFEQPLTVGEVTPPIVRGGIQMPRLDLLKWKDKGWMARDSLDRNIEKVAPRADAEKVIHFLSDHLRKAATEEVEYTNAIFDPLREKLNELGLKKGSKEASLIQKFGEGLLSPEELQRESPTKHKEIEKAVTDFRKTYDKTIDDWNKIRAEFGYPPVPKLSNYFPHFKDISFWTKTYGFLNKDDELPTSIAGKTEFFKPGKAFSRHELQRTGRETKYDAIEGMEIYIKSVARQMYSIESMQRAKALDNYVEKAALVGESLGTPLHLSEFQTNLKEVMYNQIGGKTGGLDRNIENFGKRPVINALLTVSKLIGKNIIAFNPATALTHLVSIPLNMATTGKVSFLKGLMTTVSSPFAKDDWYAVDGHRSDFLYRRYPQQHLLKTKFETVEDAGGWMLEQMDKFKARLAVSSKYYELIDKGEDPETAIKKADIYAGRIIGDYSHGQKPIIFNQKILRILAQFQFGMNDAISVLSHDIPYENRKTSTDAEGNKIIDMKKNRDGSFSEKEKNDYINQIWKYAQWAVYAYLMNQILKRIKGSGKGLDPIDLALTLARANTEGEGQSFGKRLGLAGKDFAGEIPLTSLIFGNYPTATAFSQPYKDALAGNLYKAGVGVASLFVSPIGGGLQAKKIVQGVGAIKQGEADTISQKIKALIFGPAAVTNSPIGKALDKNLQSAKTSVAGFDSSLMDKVQKVHDEAVKAGLDSPEAQALVDDLSDTEYKAYRALRNVDKAQEAVALEPKILPIIKKVYALGVDSPEAQKLVDDSFPDTPQGDMESDAYHSIKNAYDKLPTTSDTSSTSVSGPIEGEWDKQSLITHVVNIARAVGTDPITAFNDIFAGNGSYKITGITNGQIMVGRLTQSQSSRIKKSLGGNSSLILDHVRSKELGGNSATGNLWLIPKDQSLEDDKVENYLGSLLKAGKITGKYAQELELRYKKQADADYIDDRMKKVFENVGDPLTFDQLKELAK